MTLSNSNTEQRFDRPDPGASEGRSRERVDAPVVRWLGSLATAVVISGVLLLSACDSPAEPQPSDKTDETQPVPQASLGAQGPRWEEPAGHVRTV
jgi:hypothetical protein